MRVAREHEFGAERELFDHIGFVPEDDNGVLGVGFFEGGAGSRGAAIGRIYSGPFYAVLLVNLIKEKSGPEVFGDGFDLVDISSVVVAIAGDHEAFPSEIGEVLESKLEEVAVVGCVAVDKITADHEDIGVLLGEPGEGGSGEGDGLLVADVEVGNEPDAIAGEGGGPAGDGQCSLLRNEAICFDKMSIRKRGGSDSGCGCEERRKGFQE